MTIRSHIPNQVVPVTPSDTTSQPGVGFYVGGGGDVSIREEDGTSATFVGVQAGSIIPVSFIGINATGTTATNILAFRQNV